MTIDRNPFTALAGGVLIGVSATGPHGGGRFMQPGE